jgi:hypothetical protein
MIRLRPFYPPLRRTLVFLLLAPGDFAQFVMARVWRCEHDSRNTVRFRHVRR